MTATIGVDFDDLFVRAAAGLPCWVTDRSGRRHDLPVLRWLGGHHASAEDRAVDEALLARCSGSTLDLGCGPGRLVTALLDRGTHALGVDSSAVAVQTTLDRGGRAVQGDVHDALLGAGRWDRVLLADGNIGIGGDPARMLRRCRDLLRPDGQVVVELGPTGTGLWRGEVRIETEIAVGEWFPWATVGLDAAPSLAASTGLVLLGADTVRGGHVAVLGRGV